MHQDSISLVALRCQAYKKNLHIISPFCRRRSHDTDKSISLYKITVSEKQKTRNSSFEPLLLGFPLADFFHLI